MIEPILVIEIALSAAVMMAITTCAIALWAVDGPVLKLIALAFLCVSAQMLFGIAASFFLANVTTYAILKGIGQVIEGLGGLYLFIRLPRVLKEIEERESAIARIDDAARRPPK